MELFKTENYSKAVGIIGLLTFFLLILAVAALIG